MTVTNVRKDPEALTLVVSAELDATVERAWQLWADPRQLERWWGPPGYPATVVDHTLEPGGRISYFMTTPEGDTPHGYWDVLDAAPPNRLELRHGFADESGTPDEAMPVGTTVITMTERAGGGTVMAIESRFPSVEAMDHLVEMGMVEGMQEALTQIPAILAG